MNAFTHFIFALMFAAGLGSLNAPLYDDRKHVVFAKSKTEWRVVLKGTKANGLQKFSLGHIQVWAVDIEKGIEKLCRRIKAESRDVWKVSDNYYIKIRS